MIAIDTNILVRYFVRDDPRQTAMAKRLLEEELTPQRPGFVSLTVIAELSWVLRKAYSRTAAEIRGMIRDLLKAAEIEVEFERVLQSALLHHHGDLADAIIHEIARHRGCEHTVTFDRRFARLSGVELLG